jgi:hypothetical protein
LKLEKERLVELEIEVEFEVIGLMDQHLPVVVMDSNHPKKVILI